MMPTPGMCANRIDTTKYLRTLLFAIAVAAFGISTAWAQSFRAELSSQKVAYGATEPIELRLTISNMGFAEVALLSWKLPFDGVEDDIFVVTCGGKRAPYLGRLYKRAPPTAANWTRIPPGKEVSGSFDLSGSYAIEGGDCTVQFQFQLANVHAKGRDTLAGTVSSEPLFLILDPRSRPNGVIREWRLDVPLRAVQPAQQELFAALLEEEAAQRELLSLLLEEEAAQAVEPSPEEEAAAADDFLVLEGLSLDVDSEQRVEPWDEGATVTERLAKATYRSCTASRIGVLETALDSARKYAEEAYGFLTNNAGSTSRYTRWFGRFTSARHSFVKGHFSRMKSAMKSKTFSFDCGCTIAGTFAYVYPSRPYQVWLCPLFWRAKNTGRDSRAGTLVHETSHFDKVGNTDDWVYGPSESRWLALYYPEYAIRNADNHEYFVELK